MVVEVDGEHCTTVQQKGFCCRWSHAIWTIFCHLHRHERRAERNRVHASESGPRGREAGQSAVAQATHSSGPLSATSLSRSTKSNRHFPCGEATQTQLTQLNVRKMENSAVRAHTEVAERLQLRPISKSFLDHKSFPLTTWSFAEILQENLTLCRVADASACNMQKHSLENLDENNLFAFERFVPSSLQVVSLFRVGYFRDCSARPPELMYS